MERFGEPPGVYGTLAYIATSILFEAVEEAGTFDVTAVTRALESKEFETVKGAANFRQDHQLVSDYLAFFVRGKDPADSMGEWDVFEVLGHFGGASVLPPLESLGY
jgi:ABC-type branched-subunit amino acid transport system substrate-binding protein